MSPMTLPAERGACAAAAATVPGALSGTRFLSAMSAAACACACVAQGIFFQANFNDGLLPPPFDPGPPVERLTPGGSGLGEFVPAWRVGDAAQANAGGFFPVPDEPIGNRFVMANDDAPPCNCNMQEVTLTLTPPPFIGRNGVALECRIFHEGILGGGAALVEARTGGGLWTVLDTLPVLPGEWQDIFLDLSAYDGLAGVQLRFRWSDNGNWAAGFAVDDIVLRERFAHDLAVERAFTHDANVSPFTMGDQSLRYRWLPLVQAGPLTASARLMNRGTQPLLGVQAFVEVFRNGVPQAGFGLAVPGMLLPGERRSVSLPTGWTPDATGELEVRISGTSFQSDDHPADNVAARFLRITGPGWADGYGAMARDEGAGEGIVGGDFPFIALNRVELVNGGTVPVGLSAWIAAASSEGVQVRAMLFDDQLAFVDSSARHTITAEDLAAAVQGGLLYLPFTHLAARPAGDHWAGLQRLEGSGAVWVHASGNTPIGGSILMRGPTLDPEYIRAVPMVRLHFAEYGVGREEAGAMGGAALRVWPVPVSGKAWAEFEAERAGACRMVLHDALGRTVRTWSHASPGTGTQRAELDVHGLPAGVYTLRVGQERMLGSARLVVGGH